MNWISRFGIAAMFLGVLGYGSCDIVVSEILPKKDMHYVSIDAPDVALPSRPLTLEDTLSQILGEFPNKDAIDLNYEIANIYVESSKNPDVISRAGAVGYKQVTKSAWKDVSDEPFCEAYNHYKNLSYGIKYDMHIQEFLRHNMPMWNKLPKEKKQLLISAAYDGGPTRLRNREWNISKMPYETRDYVDKMKIALQVYSKNLSYASK